jgi:hypothetical protein
MPDELLRTWQFERLKHALQALASPAEIQAGLFPDFVHTSDELMLDFDNFCSVVVTYAGELKTSQIAAVEVLNRHLDTYPESAEGVEALKSHAFWAKARELALQALDSFGWQYETPPRRDHEFVLVQSRHRENLGE